MREKAIKYLLIPDVHGREFWFKPVGEVLQDDNAEIVFLGDYLDCYPHEWNDSVNYKLIAIERFRDIIEIKRENPSKVTLLLGNHDSGYAIDTELCSCRMDRANYDIIRELFDENRDLFQLGKEVVVGDKKYHITHSGILKGWSRRVWGDGALNDDFNVIERLNNAWTEKDMAVLNALRWYDRYRGWGGYEYASPIWSDIRSWADLGPSDTYAFNIVGHTMTSGTPVVLDAIADIDCKKAFYIDEDGKIKDYDNDEEILKYE